MQAMVRARELAFWNFRGSIGRVPFLVNSLILGALFGVAFTFVVPFGWRMPYILGLGAIVGAIAVLLSGLQAMYVGLFYTVLLFVAMDWRSVVVGTVMLCLLAAGYSNVVRRLRDMGAARSAHAWGVGICLLSLLPLVASFAYLTLVMAPKIVDIQTRRFRVWTAALALLAALAVIRYGPSFLMFVADPYVVQNDLNKALRHPRRYSHLNIANRQLGSLPPDIGSLENLESLNACRNRLSALPPTMAHLSNLRALYLASNQFTEFPPVLLQLRNLTVLDLGSNRLEGLPREIGTLSQLQILDVRDNPLRSLPEEIRTLRNLKSLFADAKALPPQQRRRLMESLPGLQIID
jgi:hypothetical protein